MKKQVAFIGGGDSYSNYQDYLRALKEKPIRNPHGEKTKRWTDTLAEDLGDNYEVFKPAMPNRDNAVYQEWKIWFEKYFTYFHNDVILVGWSLGGIFLAKYLSENEVPFSIAHLFLLAAPCGECDDGTGNDCGSFQFKTKALSVLTQKVANIHILHSKDDFVVPYEHALRYMEALPEATLITYEDKNHFLLETFPEFLEIITKG